jgi:hypothetical protein
MAVFAKQFNSMPFPAALERQNAIPVDSTSLWYDYDALVAYAASGKTAYVGQLVVYINEAENKSHAYIIQNDGTLGEIAGGSGKASNVDNASLVLNDNNELALYGYGKEYWKYTKPEGAENGEYVLTQGWVAGLEPRVVQNGDALVLGWYEPNPDTLDGLNSTVGTLGTSVENLNTSVGNLNTSVGELREDVESLDEILNGGTNDAGEQVIGLVTRVGNLENTVKDLTSAFVFKGVVAKFSDLAAVVDPQNGWVYKVTDTEAEYVFDGEYWVELGTVYEVDLTDYAKKSDITNALADYITNDALNEALADYVTNDALNTALADYITNDALNTALADYVTEEDFATLAGRVGTLEEAFAEGGVISELEDSVADLESAVGDLDKKLVSLEEAVGAPATEDEEATGLYKLIGDIKYIAKVKIGETVLEPDADRAIELPIFGESDIGMVPAVDETVVTKPATYFLNATGAWAIPVDARIGELKYNEQQYNTVEEYIEAYVADHGMVWEPI